MKWFDSVKNKMKEFFDEEPAEYTEFMVDVACFPERRKMVIFPPDYKNGFDDNDVIESIEIHYRRT